MDCVGKTADVIGDFASCRCSSFNMLSCCVKLRTAGIHEWL